MSPERATTGRALGVAILALTLFSVGLGVKTSADRQGDVKCLTSYIAENARVTKLRAAANVRRDQAIDNLLLGTTGIAGKPGESTRGELRRLFAAYQREIRAVAAERAANPLPELPVTCSDLDRG